MSPGEPGCHRVMVEVVPRSACAACAAGHGCGAGLFTRLFSSRSQRLTIESESEVHPGQAVWLEVDAQTVDRLAGYWYGLPAVLMLAGAAAGFGLTAGSPLADPGTLAGLLAGLAAGWWQAGRRLRLAPGVVRLRAGQPPGCAADARTTRAVRPHRQH